jgi:succinyl-CoA synthetase alpha subunit
MSILINRDTRLIVQGITGNEGLLHTQRMLDCGTHIVAGVSPGRGGEWILNGKIPVFDTVSMAKDTTGANSSVVFVPARYALDAIYESVDVQIPLIVCITEGIPIQDMMRMKSYLNYKNVTLIGPNSPGILSTGEANVGIIPDGIVKKGNIGLVSRSGTLVYEFLNILNQANMGVSTCVGIGGDPIIGTNFVRILEMFEEDPHTESIILVGEIGGCEEEIAAESILKNMTKKVVAFIAGMSAPVGRRIGHAGAIIEGRAGSASGKVESLQAAGISVANHPEEIIALIQK